jgi:hypothetical protein
MKRTIIAIVLAIGVFAGVYGLAASLGVSSDTLGAGNATVAACQAGTLTTSYTPSYSATAPAGYRATTVTIGNIGAGCQGKAYKVTLVDASNASLGEVTGTTPAAANMALTFAVSAAAVEGVHVVITG